jgi:hypothetical protein
MHASRSERWCRAQQTWPACTQVASNARLGCAQSPRTHAHQRRAAALGAPARGGGSSRGCGGGAARSCCDGCQGQQHGGHAVQPGHRGLLLVQPVAGGCGWVLVVLVQHVVRTQQARGARNTCLSLALDSSGCGRNHVLQRWLAARYVRRVASLTGNQPQKPERVAASHQFKRPSCVTRALHQPQPGTPFDWLEAGSETQVLIMQHVCHAFVLPQPPATTTHAPATASRLVSVGGARLAA